MTKMTQRDAVFSAVTNVCGTQDEAYDPSTDQRKSVNQILFEGIRSGSVELRDGHAGHTDDKVLKSYVSGLQSNWLRKDPRLNGNVKYEAKNPGSRAGSTDPQIKAMRLLLATKTDAADKAEIQAFITKRVAEIKPAKSAELTEEQVAQLEAIGLGHLVG